MSGPDIPDAVGSFDQLSSSPYSLPRYILRNVAAMGYWEPTPIQMQAIPLMLHVSQRFGVLILQFWHKKIHLYGTSVSSCVCMCICVCVCEREREIEINYLYTFRIVKSLPVPLLVLEKQLPSSYQF